jgi:hypothetical protein
VLSISITLDSPVWGNSSKESTVSSPVDPCDCPRYALAAANVGIEKPSPRNMITFFAFPVRVLLANFALRDFCAPFIQNSESKIVYNVECG